MPQDHFDTDAQGIGLGWRWTPVDAAGVYVPGGTAAYPSTLLMNVIPAQVAGVERIAMVNPDRRRSKSIDRGRSRSTGHRRNLRRWRRASRCSLGLWHPSIPMVDCIVGPGNAFVAAAKREVYGQVAIDQIAGPSEILVVADNSNNPDWIAADLLSQAEHDPSSQAILITDCDQFAQKVIDSVASQLSTLPRVQIAGASWNAFGAVITVDDLIADAPALANAGRRTFDHYSAAGCTGNPVSVHQTRWRHFPWTSHT